jgi:hypothetical protein
MAGGKETPRQKMIGMMYLVLTALLALNVTKEILDAFIAIEKNITNSALIQKENGDRIFDDMEKASTDPKTDASQKQKVAVFLEVIKKIDIKAGKAIETIDAIKIKLLENLGENTEEGKVIDDKILVIKKYNNKEKGLLLPGKYDLSAIKVKDDFDVPMQLLIGSNVEEGMVKGDYAQEGQKLWDALNTFRREITNITATYDLDSMHYNLKLTAGQDINQWKDNDDLDLKITSLLSLKVASKEKKTDGVNEKDIEELRELYKLLSRKEMDDFEIEEGKVQSVHWLGRTFNHAPVVAVLASLSSLQMEILNARTKAIVLLKRKVDVSPFAFDEIKAIVSTSGLNFSPNEVFYTTISLAAYQSSGQLKVNQSSGGGSEVSNANGEVKLKMTAPGSGVKVISGTISAPNAQGVMTSRPYSTKIAVGGRATASLEIADADILYIGYDNKIVPSVSGCDNYSVSGGGAREVAKSKDGRRQWSIRPSSEGYITVVVNGTKGGKNALSFPKKYKCKQFPKPVTLEKTISKSRGGNITAKNSDGAVIAASFTITKIKLLDGFDNPILPGSFISKEKLLRLRVGKEVGVKCWVTNKLTGKTGIEIDGSLLITQ